MYLALNATTGEMIAVKQIEMPRTASDGDDSRLIPIVDALKLESENLRGLDHPNIVQYLGFEESTPFLNMQVTDCNCLVHFSDIPSLYSFMEYIPGGSIASCLRRHGKFDEEITKSFTSQILSGLEYLHSKGILHRVSIDRILVFIYLDSRFLFNPGSESREYLS